MTLFFALNMLGFAAAAYFGISTSFTFFVWVSIFGVMMIAQFWAFAADTFNLKSGQRLFPVIMMGANLGALAGAKFAAVAVDCAAAGRADGGRDAGARRDAARRQARAARRRPKGRARCRRNTAPSAAKLLGGIELVLRDRYLLLVALFVVLLNWINTTGEYRPRRHGARATPTRRWRPRPARSTKDAVITAFYGDFQFWVTLVGLADPAAAGRAHLSLGRVPRRAARAADRRGARLRADGVRADLLDHPAGQDRGEQPSTTR